MQIKCLEATIKKNTNNNNDYDKSLNGSIGLNTAYNNSVDIMSPPPITKIKEEKRLTISPTIVSYIYTLTYIVINSFNELILFYFLER